MLKIQQIRDIILSLYFKGCDKAMLHLQAQDEKNRFMRNLDRCATVSLIVLQLCMSANAVSAQTIQKSSPVKNSNIVTTDQNSNLNGYIENYYPKYISTEIINNGAAANIKLKNIKGMNIKQKLTVELVGSSENSLQFDDKGNLNISSAQINNNDMLIVTSKVNNQTTIQNNILFKKDKKGISNIYYINVYPEAAQDSNTFSLIVIQTAVLDAVRTGVKPCNIIIPQVSNALLNTGLGKVIHPKVINTQSNNQMISKIEINKSDVLCSDIFPSQNILTFQMCIGNSKLPYSDSSYTLIKLHDGLVLEFLNPNIQTVPVNSNTEQTL